MRVDPYTGAPLVEKGIDPYHYSRSIRGVRNSRKHLKASPSSWDRSKGRTIATALDDNGSAVLLDGRATVKVSNLYTDDVSYVPASSFRRSTDATTHRISKETPTRHHMTAADMAPIQNYETDN